MSERERLNDDNMEYVVGGYMNMNYNTKILTYTHEETKNVTRYQILDFENAWKLSNELHSQNHHEDSIIAELISRGYIQ